MNRTIASAVAILVVLCTGAAYALPVSPVADSESALTAHFGTATARVPPRALVFVPRHQTRSNPNLRKEPVMRFARVHTTVLIERVSVRAETWSAILDPGCACS